MPAYSNTTQLPRNEIKAFIVQGRGLNSSNIGGKILPRYGVDRRTSHILKATIASAQLMRPLTDFYIKKAGANIERMNMTLSDDTFTINVRAREVLIPDEVEADYKAGDYASMEALAAQQAQDTIDQTDELLIANSIFNTTNFGSAASPAVNYTRTLIATMDPIRDIFAAIEAVREKGEEADTIVIPTLVWQLMRQAPKVQSGVALVNGGYVPTSTGNVTTDGLLAVFQPEGIKQILVGRNRYNTAADGATPAFTKYWSSSYLWVGRSGTAFTSEENGLETVQGVGANVFWETPDFANNGIGVFTYRDETRMSNVVRSLTTASPYIANGNAGTLIATNYSAS